MVPFYINFLHKYILSTLYCPGCMKRLHEPKISALVELMFWWVEKHKKI